jgi:hypothetical protein
MLVLCMSHRLAHDAEINGPADPDPELAYLQGAVFAYSGKSNSHRSASS